MKINIRFLLSTIMCSGLFSVIAFSSFAQTPTIYVGGSAVLVSGDAKFPIWLPAGTTLACGTNVKSISVIEYLITAGPTTGGIAQNIQQYNQNVTVTAVNPATVSVPANRVWKIEGVMMDPAANSTPGSNYFAGTGLTLTGNTFSLTNPVAVNLGGTGLAELTTGRVLIGNGTGNVTLAGPTGANQVLRSTGTDAPVWGSLVSGDIPALGGTPALTLGTSNSAGAASTYIRTDATILAFDVTAPAALGTAAVGTATVAARRDHVHPAVDLGTGVGLTGTLGVTRGGTGLTAAAQGDLFYGSAANTISRLAKDANATRYLSNTGSSNNPAWAQVNLANGVTGTLPIGNGGTGSTTQNWVDLTTAQNPIAGAKTWTSTGAFTAAGTGLSVSNNATVGGTLGVTSNITNGGFDFILGNTDQVSRGNSGNSRALVKGGSSTLIVNYAGDFTGGTQVNSNLDITGTIKIQGGSPGVGKVLTSDAAGLASWQSPYGSNIQSVLGTTDQSIASATFADLSQMTITFTPVHNTVFINFSAAGDGTIEVGEFVEFRLVKDGTVMAGTNSMVTDYDDIWGGGSGWNAQFTMYPLAVTAGVSTTIKIQWMRNGVTVGTIYNYVSTQKNYSHRNLVIID